MKKTTNAYAYRLMVAVLAIITVIFTSLNVGVGARYARAESPVALEFDETYVIDDLNASSINGKKFDISDYSFSAFKQTDVLYLAEYCYSAYANMQYNYGLYLYICNPQGLDIVTDTALNTVELSYGADTTVGYEKYPLTCLSVCREAGYERLFYKFKIEINPDSKREMLDSLVGSEERTYHVSGIELLSKNEINPTDYAINKVYTYRGYSKGYGPDSTTDTLEYSSRFGDVLNITRQGGLHQTFYRPKGSNGTYGQQDTLQTVYFSVPNKYLENDFALSQVRMEWLKAQTAWGLITGNKAVYDSLIDWVGVTEGVAQGQYIYSNTNGQPYPSSYGFSSDAFQFNLYAPMAANNYLAYLFPSDSWETDSADDYVLSWTELNQYMIDYHDKYDHDRLYYDERYIPSGYPIDQQPEPGGEFYFNTPYGGELVSVDGVTYNYSRALFQFVYPHKTTVDISAEDERTLRSVVLGKQWWDGWFGLDGSYVVSSTEFDGIEAIYAVSDKDFQINKTLTCDSLYIDESDYEEFYAFYNTAKLKNETVMLVRYDVGRYWAYEATQGIPMNGGLVSGFEPGDTNARVFSQTVYLGLDVIHLRFDNGEESFVIPCVSTPIDAGSDSTRALFTTSDNQLPWWVLVIIIVVLILAVFSIIKYGIKALFKALWWVIKTPFVLLGKFFKWLASKFSRSDAAADDAPPEPEPKAGPRAKPKQSSSRQTSKPVSKRKNNYNSKNRSYYNGRKKKKTNGKSQYKKAGGKAGKKTKR